MPKAWSMLRIGDHRLGREQVDDPAVQVRVAAHLDRLDEQGQRDPDPHQLPDGPFRAKRRRTPAASAVRRSGLRAAEASQRLPAVGPWVTQNSAPSGRVARTSRYGVNWSHADRSMPTSRRRPPLPSRTVRAPRARSRSVSARSSASLTRSPARQSTMMSARRRAPSALLLVARMTALISSTGGGSAGNRRPLLLAACPRGGRAVSPANAGGRQRRAASRLKTWLLLVELLVDHRALTDCGAPAGL